jgi:TRAP-type mannitol/chloroaromatic compound transport system substrate-binding protein
VAGGTKLLPFSAAIMDGSFAAANQVYAETTAKNAELKKVYDSMVAFRKEEVLWFRVVENTFDNYMARQSAANKL